MSMTESPTSKTAEKFVVRLPKGMRKRIAEAARCYRRSMNSEIVLRLEKTLADDVTDAPLDELPPEPEAVVEPQSALTTTELGEIERRLIALFRRLPTERQRALLALLD